MSALLELPGVGPATRCQLAKYHYPRPLRFVWHHILPEACGGTTTGDNLAQVCDSCHYSVHILLWQLGQGQTLTTGSRAQRALAREGYARAVAAGTVAHIPKEA